MYLFDGIKFYFHCIKTQPNDTVVHHFHEKNSNNVNFLHFFHEHNYKFVINILYHYISYEKFYRDLSNYCMCLKFELFHYREQVSHSFSKVLCSLLLYVNVLQIKQQRS